MIVTRLEGLPEPKVRRVAAYCRVSTQRRSQEDSFETQVDYYRDRIQATPGWVLAEIYVDRQSASSVKNRPGLQKMMADAEAGKLDLILVKSISRFARNVVDCQVCLQRLDRFGCQVWFEKERIHTGSPGSRFTLALLSAVAQDESHSVSQNVRLAVASRYRRGEYRLGNNRILGYDQQGGALVPNGEAWMVRTVFHLFLSGSTYQEISREILARGGRSLRGNQTLSPETIRYMLRNETYAGDKRLQKQPPRDYLTKRPDPTLEYSSYYLENDHAPIIDRQTWQQTQALIQTRQLERRSGIHRRGHHHPLYGRLFCGLCDAPYLRKSRRGEKIWICKGRLRGNCSAPILKEATLTPRLPTPLPAKILVSPEKIEYDLI